MDILVVSKHRFYKKLITLSLALLLVAGLTSCKKEYTCKCTVAGISSATTTIKDTKKNAESKCNEGDSNVLGVVTDCEIQ
jgi:hypothetical protein